MIPFPDGWAPGTWRISGVAPEGGWLATPPATDPEVADWIDSSVETLREAWGTPWDATTEDAVRAMVTAAPAHRRVDDALAFQFWPVAQPLCVFVHVAIGVRDREDPLPGPGDGILFETDGLGPGVLVPRVEQFGAADVVGYDVVFAFDDDVVVVLSAEPTFADLLGVVAPAIHTFAATLTLVGPDGRSRRANPPDLLEARPENTWTSAQGAAAAGAGVAGAQTGAVDSLAPS